MKLNKQLGIALTFAIIFILIAGFNNQQVQAVEIGGELNLNAGLNYQADGDLSTTFSGSTELEFYLPAAAGIEPRLVMQGSLRDTGDADFNFKYLYLRRRFDSGHLTLGRQPVSWSYGAVINPYDYGFSIEGLAGETLTPGIDGARYFHSLGAGRSLQAVINWPEYNSELNQLGFGTRLRLPGQGYDLSFNLASHEIPEFDFINSEIVLIGFDRLTRAGITYSGDIGELGAYGAAGYYRLNDSEIDDWVIQLGLDYSWQTGEFADRQVMVQGEYLRFIQNDLDMNALLGLALSNQSFGGQMPGGDMPANGVAGGEIFTARDLFILNISTNLDSFTNIGLALLGETENKNLMAAPYYISDLGGGLELRIDGSIGLDSNNDINTGISAGMTYYF
ncbi:hypothetical protein I0Q91_03170 [Halanaerobiaceae bacterium Z-7014]|uniref:Porin n=1 Tax=Halonatronomonas betaini TaxID=2778430 RepID=A0A931ANJ2_9FIRM|nr:hypothetical protein [Halonatronomonas betaini]MBF8436068.1 hypothetical protein [Halonatronomonas betaini]